jgi:hypothetical protein
MKQIRLTRVQRFIREQLGAPHKGGDRSNRQKPSLPKLTCLKDEVCDRCDIFIRPEGGHLCGTCGRNV